MIKNLEGVLKELKEKDELLITITHSFALVVNKERDALLISSAVGNRVLHLSRILMLVHHPELAIPVIKQLLKPETPYEEILNFYVGVAGYADYEKNQTSEDFLVHKNIFFVSCFETSNYKWFISSLGPAGQNKATKEVEYLHLGGLPPAEEMSPEWNEFYRFFNFEGKGEI